MVQQRVGLDRPGIRPVVNGTLVDVLTSADALLFDFDGPLCDVFAGMPAPGVARRLERLAGRSFPTDDPLAVLRGCYHECSPEIAVRVEDELVQAEVGAVDLARAEPGGIDSLRAAHAADMPAAVVTNNAGEAASRFLHAHGLVGLVVAVVGRALRRPDRMKPDPWSLLAAADALGVEPARTVLIGDSTTDIEAGHAAGVPCIGYANKPGKRVAFEQLGAAVVIDDMGELAAALRARAGASPQRGT